MDKHSSLRRSLSKRAEKQALIRDNTGKQINIVFARYAAAVPGAQLVHSEAQSKQPLDCIAWCMEGRSEVVHSCRHMHTGTKPGNDSPSHVRCNANCSATC